MVSSTLTYTIWKRQVRDLPEGLTLHGDEIPYIFGTLESPSSSDLHVSQWMMKYWANFAKTGGTSVSSNLQISATKWGGLGLQYRLPARIFLYKQEGLCPPFCIWNNFVVDSFQITICTTPPPLSEPWWILLIIIDGYFPLVWLYCQTWFMILSWFSFGCSDRRQPMWLFGSWSWGCGDRGNCCCLLLSCAKKIPFVNLSFYNVEHR